MRTSTDDSEEDKWPMYMRETRLLLRDRVCFCRRMPLLQGTSALSSSCKQSVAPLVKYLIFNLES